MPYNKNDYPNSMKNLKEDIRNKAIDILNELIDEGYEEGRAIPLSISRAKEWYENRGEKLSDDITHHLKPDGDHWVLKNLETNESKPFDTKKEAMEKVKEISKEKSAKTLIFKENGEFQQVY